MIFVIKFKKLKNFTRKGIDHFDLFFPDGTVPSKNILLQFLEISETARAAIAVHCKAGLGRTGSLIGAYIVKHYNMTAREAIAWMRICRPGSVIAQQQGWLEKIESWLWKQGNRYRIQHFGEGDKIPRHKYGIYSNEWAKERENLIKHVQKRKLDTQHNRMKLRSDNVDRLLKDLPTSIQGGVCDASPNKKQEVRRNTIPAEKTMFLNSAFNYKLNPGNQGQESMFSRNSSLDRAMQRIINVNDKQFCNDISPRPRSKRPSSFSKYNELNSYQTQGPIGAAQSYLQQAMEQNPNYSPLRTFPLKLKKRDASPGREQIVAIKQIGSKSRRDFIDSTEQTQGDKLNEIKAKKCANFHRSSSKSKGTSSRREPEVIYQNPDSLASKCRDPKTRSSSPYGHHINLKNQNL